MVETKKMLAICLAIGSFAVILVYLMSLKYETLDRIKKRILDHIVLFLAIAYLTAFICYELLMWWSSN